MLNEEILSHKYLLMKKAAMIVNVGTTFAFDAALANARVIQLSVDSDKYGSFNNYTKGAHLKKYLLNSLSHSYDGEISSLQAIIENHCNMAFSQKLKGWLNNHQQDHNVYKNAMVD